VEVSVVEVDAFFETFVSFAKGPGFIALGAILLFINRPFS
jgi:hypothetical protein